MKVSAHQRVYSYLAVVVANPQALVATRGRAGGTAVETIKVTDARTVIAEARDRADVSIAGCGWFDELTLATLPEEDVEEHVKVAFASLAKSLRRQTPTSSLAALPPEGAAIPWIAPRSLPAAERAIREVLKRAHQRARARDDLSDEELTLARRNFDALRCIEPAVLALRPPTTVAADQAEAVRRDRGTIFRWRLLHALAETVTNVGDGRWRLTLCTYCGRRVLKFNLRGATAANEYCLGGRCNALDAKRRQRQSWAGRAAAADDGAD